MSAKSKTKRSRRTAGGNRRKQSDGGFRRMAARVIFWALLAVVTVSIVGGIIFGLHYVLFAANPHFTLEHIIVSGTHTLAENTVRQRLIDAGAVPRESNLLMLPTAALRQELESDALVSQAQVVRILPDTLTVAIQERSPIASVQCLNPCFVDEEGIVLPWRDLSGERILPMITGVRQAHKLKVGSTAQDEALKGAVRLLRLLKTRPDGVAYDIAVIQLDYYLPALRVHLRPRGTFREGAVVVIPVQGMNSALDRLRDICRIRSAEGRSTGFVDVTYTQNVPVRP